MLLGTACKAVMSGLSAIIVWISCLRILWASKRAFSAKVCGRIAIGL